MRTMTNLEVISMKKYYIALVVLMVLIAGQVSVQACCDKEKMHDKQLKMMTKKLDLTDDQVKKVDELLKNQGEVMKKNHEEFQTKLKGILTPEQSKKFEAKMEKRKKSCCK